MTQSFYEGRFLPWLPLSKAQLHHHDDSVRGICVLRPNRSGLRSGHLYMFTDSQTDFTWAPRSHHVETPPA